MQPHDINTRPPEKAAHCAGWPRCPLAGLLDAFQIGIFFADEYGFVGGNRACAKILEIPEDTPPETALTELRTRLGLALRPQQMDHGKPRECAVKVATGVKNVLFAAAPRPTEGVPAGWVGAVAEVTGTQVQQDANARRERLAALGQLAAGLAHEIRNPLTSIRGFCQLLDSLVTDEKNRRYLKVLIREVDRMDGLIGAFMELARPRRSGIVKTDLNELVREILLLVDSRCFMNRIKVREITNEIPPVHVDRDQIKQVLLNIVNNAIEAMEHQERPRVLTVVTTAAEGDLRIIVEDTGGGIPEDVRGEIGKPFFSTKETGTGLGLSICYRIIREHGGTITVQSRAQSWTRFVISLPLLLAQHNPETEQEPSCFP